MTTSHSLARAMLTLTGSMVLGVGLYLASPSESWACPSNNPTTPPPGTPGAATWLLREAGLEGQVEILGLVASSTQAGDSCGIAPHLPSDLIVTGVSVNDAATGKPLFLSFEENGAVTKTLCDDRLRLRRNRQGCRGFAAPVGPAGLVEGTPLQIVLEFRKTGGMGRKPEAGGEAYLQQKQIQGPKIANALARSATVTTAGVSQLGEPERHLLVHPAQTVDVCLGPDDEAGLPTCDH